MAGGILYPSPTPDQLYARNSQWVQPGASNFQTQLGPMQELMFRNWVQQNNIPFDPNNTKSDYDMRGYWNTSQSPGVWKMLQGAGKIPSDMSPASTKVDPNDGKPHFPDYWKTPYHETFSNESQWATPSAPGWTADDKLVTPGGQVVYDDRAQGGN